MSLKLLYIQREVSRAAGLENLIVRDIRQRMSLEDILVRSHGALDQLIPARISVKLGPAELN